MIVLLAICAVLSGALGCFVWTTAESAVHETVALLSLLIFTVSIGMAGIISAIEQVRKLLEQKLGPLEENKESSP